MGFNWSGEQFDPPERKWTFFDWALIVAAIAIFTAVGILAAGGPS